MSPRDGSVIQQYEWPCYGETELAPGQKLPVYARLDFDAIPIQLQPNFVLVMWLAARGVRVGSTEIREHLEYLVEHAEHLQCPILPPHTQITSHKYTGFEVLKPRLVGPEHYGCLYNKWNKNYFPLVERMQSITDELIDDLLGIEWKHLWERALLLVKGGNFDLGSVEVMHECQLFCE